MNSYTIQHIGLDKGAVTVNGAGEIHTRIDKPEKSAKQKPGNTRTLSEE